jgi:cobalt-zinc-cadmium efflux system protein
VPVAVLVSVTGWLWLVALTAIGVGTAVIWSSTDLLREAIELNLDAAPQGVVAVEELHVWGLSTSSTALTHHLLIDVVQLTQDGSGREKLLAEVREHLRLMGIRKSTIELVTG